MASSCEGNDAHERDLGYWEKLCCCDCGGDAASNARSTLFLNLLLGLVNAGALFWASKWTHGDVSTLFDTALALPLNAVIYNTLPPAVPNPQKLWRLQQACYLVVVLYALSAWLDLFIEGAAGEDRRHWGADCINDIGCCFTWCQTIYWNQLVLLEWRQNRPAPADPQHAYGALL